MSQDGVALGRYCHPAFSDGLFFPLASPAFLLVKLDIPPVTQLLRGMFSVHFLMTSVAGVIGTVAFALTGRPLFAVGVALITAPPLAVWSRRWFLQQWDVQLSARDAGDADAVRRLRRLHWGGMLSNAIQLVAIVCSIPYVAATRRPDQAGSSPSLHRRRRAHES